VKIYHFFILTHLWIGQLHAGAIQSTQDHPIERASLKSLNIQRASYQLPDLPYPYDAFEQVIDTETMKLHHGKHHQAYINNLNKQLGSDHQKTLLQVLSTISTYNIAVRNNGGGHWNHSFFWTVLTPDKKQNQMPQLLRAEIEKHFKSFDQFKTQFEAAALGLFGSGWVWLIRTTEGKLVLTTTLNQDNPLMDVIDQRGTPLLALDVWEHAYYLKYQNKRADYVNAFWSIVNWEQVEYYRQESLK
jgi:superoxide dismutase, Fe-Mn family